MQECDTKELIECYNKIVAYIKSLEGKKEEADNVKDEIDNAKEETDKVSENA